MFDQLSKQVVKQLGGAQVSSSASWSTTFLILLISLIILFIKVLLVHWSYNEVIPSLFNEKYRPISITEALYLVILIQTLFT